MTLTRSQKKVWIWHVKPYGTAFQMTAVCMALLCIQSFALSATVLDIKAGTVGLNEDIKRLINSIFIVLVYVLRVPIPQVQKVH